LSLSRGGSTTSINIDRWIFEVRQDVRLSHNARDVAHGLAKRFRGNDNCGQLSFEKIADMAGIISLSNAREALRQLHRTGWLTSGHVANTSCYGKVYRPVMSQSAAGADWSAPENHEGAAA
jgi:hypothetical protein